MRRDANTAVAEYFRAKRRELMALADLPVCGHPGLTGSHREQIYRTYLADILPRRYSVGRGVVYGLFHRSREADIVIWDSHAYPSLPLHDHSFYFAESVRAVIECKSSWSTSEFSDMLEKAHAVRDIVPHREPSLADELAQIQLDIACLKAGRSHAGLMISSHHIATTGIFLKGGQRVDPEELLAMCRDEIDLVWPDILLFLEPGFIAIKNDPAEDEVHGSIDFFRFADDALLAFSSALLKKLDDRVVHSESRFYIDRYAYPLLDANAFFSAKFRLMRFAPSRVPLWK
jgi:hypothetical protein